MNKEEYLAFWQALVSAELAPLHEHELDEKGLPVFEGCLPVEVIAKRGEDALRYGPFRPVGLTDQEGRRPYAVLQLRRENTEATLFNLVGCQTRLKWGEQKRVFQLIPALQEAEFVRYGVMHRNTFINSPRVLNAGFSSGRNPRLFLAGKSHGCGGYGEAPLRAFSRRTQPVFAQGTGAPCVLPGKPCLGRLAHYIATADPAISAINALRILPAFGSPVRATANASGLFRKVPWVLDFGKPSREESLWRS